MKQRQLYQSLLGYFGPQGWWPILEKRRGGWRSVYKTRRRLRMSQMFEIAIGAILTQNAAWKNAEKALVNLKKNQLLASGAIYKVSQKRLARLIKPSGYFNQKARKLKIFADWLVINYHGDLRLLFKKSTILARTELLRLWGLGPETVDSILLYAGGKPVFVVDAYTKRLLAKYNKMHTQTYEEYRDWFERGLPKEARIYNEYHALIVAWAKLNRTDPVEAAEILHLHPRQKGVR